MFTGIVEMTAKLSHKQSQDASLRLQFTPEKPLAGYQVGESIAVNGVCLTVVDFDESSFFVEVVAESLRRSNLGQLEVGDEVNIERALLPTTRLGGHFVQGHVDATTTLMSIEMEGDSSLITFSLPPALKRYLVVKGFITIDGMSLTIAKLNDDSFTIAFIPHTKKITIVRHYQKGTMVNIEVDVLAKYTEKLLGEK